MRFLADAELYSSTEHCLRFLRELPAAAARASTPERYHLYWSGPFGRKQAFAVKSFLATQDPASAELWLWLDAGGGHEANPVLRPLLPFVQVRRFDPRRETEGTPLAGRADLYEGVNSVVRSDLARFVLLFRYGGVYVDADTMFLRDMRILVERFPDEFCYRWSGQPYANSAVLRLLPGSDTARALLERCRELGTCRPHRVLDLGSGDSLDLLVLPSAFFDPLWLHRDGLDRYAGAPFDRFGHFFRRLDWRFRGRRDPGSYRDFFPGAFTYHWHNGWDAPEHGESYFGRFEKELDELLGARLGAGVTAPGAERPARARARAEP